MESGLRKRGRELGMEKVDLKREGTGEGERKGS